jgi:hypothetical protein
VSVFFVIGLPQAHNFCARPLANRPGLPENLREFSGLVNLSSYSLAFGFYHNLVTRIKPINSLIQLKTVFLTQWARDFKTLPHYFRPVSCMMLQVLIFTFPIIHSLHRSRYTFPVNFRCLSSRSRCPHLHMPHIHKKRNYTVGEILTPYLPSQQLESGQTNAEDTSEVVFPNF